MSYNNNNLAFEYLKKGVEMELRRELEEAIVKPRVEEYEKELREMVRETTKKICISKMERVHSPMDLIDELGVFVKIKDFNENL